MGGGQEREQKREEDLRGKSAYIRVAETTGQKLKV